MILIPLPATNSINNPTLHYQVSPLPLGITYVLQCGVDYGSWHNRINPFHTFKPSTTIAERDNLIDKLRASIPPTPSRKMLAFGDFHFNKRVGRTFYTKNRSEVFELLKDNPNVVFPKYRLPWLENAREKSQYAFDISIPGNGMDCYRTWESLLLGMIVITELPRVKQLTYTETYKGFPVVVIANWSDITAENLQKWSLQYGDVLNDSKVYERLTSAYWLKRMRSYPGAPQQQRQQERLPTQPIPQSLS